MRYVRIDWLHEHESDPYLIYSEIGLDGYERRKIQFYKSGSIGFAIDEIEYNGAGLSEKPFPPLQELNAKDEWDEIVSVETNKSEFENIWNREVIPLIETGSAGV